MGELKTLSKLKQAGKLHYWRGTLEIDEHELHAICDEIQAEYDKVVAAMNKAAGNWARADSRLRESNGKVPELGERENEGVRESYSRWHELFGTPERAAQTLENGTPLCSWCDTNACDKRGGECSLFDYDALLEWLRGDAE